MHMSARLRCLRHAGALTLCSLLLLAPGNALAQEPKDDANAQYRRAFAALAEKNWPEARRQLLPLWDQAHTWDVAAGLGQAEFLLDNHALGATYTAFAVANVPPKEKTKTVERLRAALEEMKRAVGTVHIAVNQDRAEIVVDDAPVGSSPLAREVYLEPGTHVLEARLPQGARGKQTLEVEAGRAYQVELVVAPSFTGAAGLASTGASSAVAATRSPAPSPSPDGASPNWAPVFIAGGLAVVAAGIGTCFAIDASSAKSDGEQALSNAEAAFGSNPCTPAKGGGFALCERVSELEDRRKRSNAVATGSFIATGVFAAAAVGSYFLWAKPSSPRLDAWLGTDGGGLGLNGSF